MTVLQNRSLYFCVLILCIHTLAQAQSTSNNPFSMYGLGEIDQSDYGRNTGMGGVGIAMNLPNTLNMSNPASLTSIDSMKMIFDFSIAGRKSNYSTSASSLNSNSFNYKRIALSFRCTEGWGSSIGLTPYSNVGYDIISSQSVEGTLQTYDVEFIGKGGINKLFWMNSFALNKYLSVGINSSVLFGSVAQTQTNSSWTINKNAHVSKIYFDFGMQFHYPISTNYSVGLGAVYGYKTKFNMQNDVDITNSNTVFGSETTKLKQYLPQFYGLGLSICKSNLLTLAADYKFTGWSVMESNNSSIKYADTHKLAIGLDYSPFRRVAYSYFDRIGYQVGASISNSILKRGGANSNNIGYTCGLGFPLMNGSRINIAYEYGNAGSTSGGLVLEKYHQISLNLSFAETWFLRRKIN